MEKISHIVPASTRQIWNSGEQEKPKRVSEPTLEDRVRDKITLLNRKAPELESEQAVLAAGEKASRFQEFPKGSRVDVSA